MNDAIFENTKEGMHESAKKTGLPAYSLGCTCEDCNKEFDKVLADTSNHIDYNGESYVKTSYAIEQMHACSKESISLTAMFVLKWTKDLELYEAIMDIGVSK